MLIRGRGNLSPNITSGEYERLNVENVFLTAAVKYPTYLPHEEYGFELNFESIVAKSSSIMDYWRKNGYEGVILSEYIDHIQAKTMLSPESKNGSPSIKCIEGEPLENDWFFNSVKAIHKNYGQSVIECKVIYNNSGRFVVIDHDMLTFETFTHRFKPVELDD
ncbi:MAG: hypothetical protein AB7O73_15755 [Bacteroidia bacterium]